MGITLQAGLIFFFIKVSLPPVMLENLALGLNSVVQIEVKGVDFILGGISEGIGNGLGLL